MQTATLRRRMLPLAALVASTALAGCYAPEPATTSYTYNYPSGYSVTTTTYPAEYPLYSPYYKGYGYQFSNGGRG